ncbi:hypothetical protein, partial [Agathobaculum butyriciproducens]|uniref:hypothetical protein n=1 Tax=Agathobaculum butyriciproducens TaxID=1628085 RepID=UPI003AAD4599
FTKEVKTPFAQSDKGKPVTAFCTAGRSADLRQYSAAVLQHDRRISGGQAFLRYLEYRSN